MLEISVGLIGEFFYVEYDRKLERKDIQEAKVARIKGEGRGFWLVISSIN